MTDEVHDTDVELQARHLRLIQEACAQAAQVRPPHFPSSAQSPGVSSEPPTVRGGPNSDTPPHDSFTGYRLIREIHRGGQGVVYQAIQESTKRKVAIKVMKEGPFASTTDKARFDREVQILGQLQHPNIVAIHDTGVAAGHHYFVMDFISGQSLDVFMASGQRRIDETLGLFATICDAVNAAHLRGIIHRDLKPSNIRIDGNGEPRILDFGLAKMGAGPSDASMTMTGVFIGSLPWASPEQTEGILSTIDTRTDVYSLGVILYQMLTGKLPYDVTGTIYDVFETIQKAEPNRPSAIRKGLNDEVDTIVLKCLDKERERRYQTAGELGRDIRHYLAGDPIEAKRNSVYYVLFKQLRKFKLPATIAAMFVLIITIGFITSLTLWRRAERAQLNENRQRKVAEAVNSFLQEMLSSPKPDKSLGVDVTVRTVLDEAADRIEHGSLRNEPETVAAVRTTIGTTYRALGLYEKAERLLRQALTSLRRHHGDDHLNVAKCLNYLGSVLLNKGEYEEAERLFREALAIQLRLLDDRDPDIGISRSNLALVLQKKGNYDEAERGLREALSQIVKVLPPGHRNVAASQNRLAMCLQQKGNYDEAEPLFLEALAIFRMSPGNEGSEAIIVNNLADIYLRKGDAASAEPLVRKALDINRKLQVPQPDALIQILVTLGEVLAAKGDPQGAQSALREALAIEHKTLPENNWHRAYAESLLGRCLADLHQYEEAEPLLKNSYPIIQAARGEQDEYSVKALQGIVDLYEAWGKPDLAAEYRATLAQSRRPP